MLSNVSHEHLFFYGGEVVGYFTGDGYPEKNGLHVSWCTAPGSEQARLV